MSTATAANRLANRPSWPTFKRLFRGYVLPHWRIGLVAIVTMVLYSATETGIVALIRPLLDDGLVERDAATLRLFAGLLLGLLVLQGVAFFLSQYLSSWISLRLVKRLRLEAHDRLLAMPYAAFEQLSTGQLVSRLTYQANQTAQATGKVIVTVFRDAVTVVLIAAYMVYLSPWLILIMALVLPLVGGIIAYINNRFRRLSRRIHRAVGGIGGVAEESVHGQQEIKLFGQEQRERRRFERLNEQNRRRFMRFLATRYASVPLIRLVVAAALAITMALATMEAVVETLTVGTVTSFLGAMLLLNTPLKRIAKLSAQLQKGLTAAEGLFELVDTPPEPDHGRRALDRAEGHIAYRGVRFSYDGRREVLRGIDLEAAPGETVALTGPSGGGKSTLIHLLMRFYEPTAGEIRLDGAPLPAYRLEDLRRQIAPITQNDILFSGTVAENIAYGAQGPVSEAAIRRAAEIAHARPFIEELPQGFDTPVGQHGALLSGGQRQRITIARAVLKDAPILLLDEATSALDAESERAVQAALERLMADRTAFVIAHRLSTVEHADRILFIEDGRIVEQGTHAELLARDGRYAQLYRLQFQASPAAPPASEAAPSSLAR
ncbi:lipid A export permease/ATP-binding protein MsbA [Halorhodospira neutriphila]|uniref:Lipid A export permease/ATP-binding protein MsbA n=1 Tax=Halorhodospira neutriphila TaxID=168379 RepID=A0ABS1E3A1_9GAMM|nr:lipid A export permease/ATP-binding protein MsbA [Halorhodospira neutriphila]MBK1725622.1 lipid A export permease/ATP-binding protein MsbA [Halorhodospira neutriphila]